jgi:hypothetical protein
MLAPEAVLQARGGSPGAGTVHVSDGHSDPDLGEALTAGFADSAGAAGDDCDFSFQIEPGHCVLISRKNTATLLQLLTGES